MSERELEMLLANAERSYHDDDYETDPEDLGE